MNLSITKLGQNYYSISQKCNIYGTSPTFGRNENHDEITSIQRCKNGFLTEITTTSSGHVVKKVHKDNTGATYREETFYEPKSRNESQKLKSEKTFDTSGDLFSQITHSREGERIEAYYNTFIINKQKQNKLMQTRQYDAKNNLIKESDYAFDCEEGQSNYYKTREIEYYPTKSRTKKKITTYNPDELNNAPMLIREYFEDGKTLKSETTFSSTKNIKKIVNGREIYVDAFNVKTVRTKTCPETEEIYIDEKLTSKIVFDKLGGKRIYEIANQRLIRYTDYDSCGKVTKINEIK